MQNKKGKNLDISGLFGPVYWSLNGCMKIPISAVYIECSVQEGKFEDWAEEYEYDWGGGEKLRGEVLW